MNTHRVRTVARVTTSFSILYATPFDSIGIN